MSQAFDENVYDTRKRSGAMMPLHQLSFVDGMNLAKFRLRSRKTMIALSHVIEDHGATWAADTILIATFQRLSLFAVEANRYQRLAETYTQMYVFGVQDVPIADMPNLTVVPLEPDWPLVQEWNVIASGPQTAVGLFARDTEGFRLKTRSRSFEGLFTTDTEIIDAAVARLYTMLQKPPRRFERDRRATFRNAELVKRALAQQL